MSLYIVPRKAKVIDVNNEATTYGNIADTVKEEQESTLQEETEIAPGEQETEPTPAPKARAKRTP